MTLAIRPASISAVTSSALRAARSRAYAAYNPNMNVFPVEADVAACRLLAAARADDAVLGASAVFERLEPWQALRALRAAAHVSQ